MVRVRVSWPELVADSSYVMPKPLPETAVHADVLMCTLPSALVHRSRRSGSSRATQVTLRVALPVLSRRSPQISSPSTKSQCCWDSEYGTVAVSFAPSTRTRSG